MYSFYNYHSFVVFYLLHIQNLFLKGFTVFAGFSTKVESEEAMQKLKQEASGRLHILQLDVTSEHDIHSTFLYVNENLPDGAPG